MLNFKLDPAKMRAVSYQHRGEAKDYSQALGLFHIILAYAEPTGAVQEKRNQAFFQEISGISRNTYFKVFANCKRFGLLSGETVREGGKFARCRIKITAPFVTATVEGFQTEVEVEEEPCTKNWDTVEDRVPNFGTREGEKPTVYQNLVQEYVIRDTMEYSPTENINLVGGVGKDPTGPPTTSGKEEPDTELDVDQDTPTPYLEKENKLKGEYVYNGKYPHSWSAATLDEYGFKEQVYEWIMADKTCRKVFDAAAKECSAGSDKFAHEFLEGLARNDKSIGEKLKGVPQLIKAHADFMEGPFKSLPISAPEGELSEFASKAVEFCKQSWGWHSKNPYTRQPEEWAGEESAVMAIVRKRKMTMDEVRCAIILFGATNASHFGKFSDYVQETGIWAQEIREHMDAAWGSIIDREKNGQDFSQVKALLEKYNHKPQSC